MAKPVLICFVLVLKSLFSVMFAQSNAPIFNPKEVKALDIFPLGWGMREKEMNEFTARYGKAFIAVKFKDVEYYNPNNRKNERIVDHYYIFSSDKSIPKIWGMVTVNKVFSSTGKVIQNISIPTSDEIIGLSSDICSFPLSVSFVAVEKSNMQTYVTETYLRLGFELDLQTITPKPIIVY